MTALEGLAGALAMVAHQLGEAETWPDFEERRGAIERGAALAALSAVCEFLTDDPRTREGADPLVRLVRALHRLEQGQTDPMLERAAAAGRPKVPDEVLTIRGRVAAVQQILMHAGKGEREAAQFVFRALGANAVERLMWRRGGSAATWRSVKKWRDEVDLAPAAKEGFNTFMETTRRIDRKPATAEAEALARVLLRALARTTLSLVPAT